VGESGVSATQSAPWRERKRLDSLSPKEERVAFKKLSPLKVGWTKNHLELQASRGRKNKGTPF